MLTTTLNYLQLQSVLLKLGKAVDANPVVPITKHVHFLPGKAITTNFNVTIVANLDCTAEFLLPYRKLLEISALLTQDLHVTVSATSVTLRSGTGVWKMGVPVDTKEFPKEPEAGEEAFTVTSDFWQHFKRAEDSTWVPLDGEQEKEYQLCCTCIEGNGENIWLMGANKRYCYTGQVVGEWEGRVLLDNKLTRSLHGLSDATVRISDSHFIAVTSKLRVYVRRTDQNYYALRTILGPHEANYIVDRDILVNTIAKVSIGEMTPIVTFTFRDNKILLHCSGGATEESADEELDCCSYMGKTLHVNGRDFMRLLRLLPSGEVSITFGEPDKAIFIQTPVAEDAPGGNEQYDVMHDESGRPDAWIYNCLIMPVVKAQTQKK